MLRTLLKSDLEQLLLIEQAVHVTPWSRDTFLICLQSDCIGWVIEIDDKIIAFIIVSMPKEECHVLNLCVMNQYQHQGWGKALLEHAISEAKKLKIAIIYLEVRITNSRAISLYRKMKFHLIGQRKEYYPSPEGLEDALIFAKNLQKESES